MSKARDRRRARAVAIAALGMVAASSLLSSAGAQTDPAAGGDPDAPTLGGYEGSAHASGIHVFYNPDGVLPTAAILDAGAPDALATISSGPATFARASSADPGDLLVNPDALLTQADPSYPSGAIPAYPYRISANSTVGEPRSESKPAPGLDSSVEATPEGSTAESRMAAAAAPGLATFGSVNARSTSTFDGSTVEVRARSEVSGFDFLGLLEIESIVTEVAARTSGGDTTVEGGTVVTGATFMDQPVIIDEEGLRTDPEADEPEVPLLGGVRRAAPAALLQAFSDAGVRVSLPGPVEQDGETAGRIGSTGLRIDIEVSERTAPLLGQLAKSLPPLENPIPGAPSAADVGVLVGARHLSAIEVGRAEAALTGRPGFTAPPFDAAGPVATPSFGSAVAPVPALSLPVTRSSAPVPAAPAASVGTPTETVADTGVPAASLGAGIGALALLALLAQPFMGDRIARGAAAVLATGPTDTCPLAEEP